MFMSKSTALGVALLLLMPLAGAAAQPSEKAAPTAAAPPEMVELRRAGYEASYNLDYATARAKFEEIRRRWPQHPAGDLYVANVVWLEYLYRLRRLQTSLYQNESFYAGVESSSEKTETGDALDPQVDRTFRALMSSAKLKALALVNANRDDADARYYLGAVYGVLAGYEASTARKFFAAMRNGSRGVEQHQQTLKLRPEYYDAYLSVGLYDYVVGNLPFALKTLALLGGVRGNKERGIGRLQQIVERRAENADDARVMLLAIYQQERRPAEALALLDDLTARFPQNFLFKLERAASLAQLDRRAEAAEVFEGLLKAAKQHAPLARSLDLVHFQYAESLALQNEHERAAAHFLSAAKEPGAEAGLATFALLRAAQSYDLANRRAEAVAQYKAVLARPNVYDSRERAEKGLRQPFRESDLSRRANK
jgi:hypothetical protein